jgi:hypothetical protein
MESLERRGRPLSTLIGRAEAPLIANLPQNSTDYAYAAQEAGADCIVAGIDRTEPAFPGLFGSFELQEDSISAILSTCTVPVGISIGDSRVLTRDAWERIVAKQFSFVAMYAHHMPTFVLEDSRIEKMLSIGPGYMLEQVKSISEMDEVLALESAIVSPQGKMHVFSVLDLATLRVVARLSHKPVLLRTQKRLEPGDMRAALRVGVRGISLDPSALEPGVEAYRDAISTFRSRVIQSGQATQ